MTIDNGLPGAKRTRKSVASDADIQMVDGRVQPNDSATFQQLTRDVEEFAAKLGIDLHRALEAARFRGGLEGEAFDSAARMLVRLVVAALHDPGRARDVIEAAEFYDGRRFSRAWVNACERIHAVLVQRGLSALPDDGPLVVSFIDELAEVLPRARTCRLSARAFAQAFTSQRGKPVGLKEFSARLAEFCSVDLDRNAIKSVVKRR